MQENVIGSDNISDAGRMGRLETAKPLLIYPNRLAGE